MSLYTCIARQVNRFCLLQNWLSAELKGAIYITAMNFTYSHLFGPHLVSEIESSRMKWERMVSQLKMAPKPFPNREIAQRSERGDKNRNVLLTSNTMNRLYYPH